MRTAGAALTALALAGCAPLPPLGEQYQQKTAEDFATAQSLAAREGNWPADDWWRGYGDAQQFIADRALKAHRFFDLFPGL